MKDKVWEKGSDLCLLNMPNKALFAEQLRGSKPELLVWLKFTLTPAQQKKGLGTQ